MPFVIITSYICTVFIYLRPAWFQKRLEAAFVCHWASPRRCFDLQNIHRREAPQRLLCPFLL
jgi:hypothetical protein